MKEIVVSSYYGLITKEGKLRLAMRVEEKSMFPGVSYKGDFELPGGMVEGKLKDILCPSILAVNATVKVKSKLGIEASAPVEFPIYRTVYEYPDGKKEDWALMIPVGPDRWDEKAEIKRKTVDVAPDDLDVLGKLMLVVSGKKRMWRMGQGALYALSSNIQWRQRAAELLNEVRSDWKETEYFEDSMLAMARFKQQFVWD